MKYPEAFVIRYRKVVGRLESDPKSEKSKLQARIKQMHFRWKEWQGEDSLHEMAYGEPVE